MDTSIPEGTVGTAPAQGATSIASNSVKGSAPIPDADTLDKLSELIAASHNPKLLQTPVDDPHTLRFVTNGRAQQVELIPRPVRVAAQSASGLAQWAMAIREYLTHRIGNFRFYYWADGKEGGGALIEVEGVIHGTLRRMSASLTLPYSPQYLWLVANTGVGKWLDQETLVDALRSTLRDSAPRGLAGQFAHLRFTTGGDVTSRINAADRSLAATQREAVSSDTDSLPDEIEFNIPVFDAHGFRDERVPVTFALRCEKSRFNLREVENSFSKAREAAALEILKRFNNVSSGVEEALVTSEGPDGKQVHKLERVATIDRIEGMPTL